MAQTQRVNGWFKQVIKISSAFVNLSYSHFLMRPEEKHVHCKTFETAVSVELIILSEWNLEENDIKIK